MKDVHVLLPPDANDASRDRQIRFRALDRLNDPPLVDFESTVGFVQKAGIPIAEIPPLTALYLEIKSDTKPGQ